MQHWYFPFKKSAEEIMKPNEEQNQTKFSSHRAKVEKQNA